MSAQCLPWRGEYEEWTVYTPKKEPSFVAWAAAWEYGDGRYGVSFDEIIEEPNPAFDPPKLEYAESAGVPVSYSSVEAGSAQQRAFRVYLCTEDGRHFYETGRCPRSEGTFCTVGFPDGRLVGFDVPRTNAERTGWSEFIAVRESLDGGSTWVERKRLLEGCAPYLWRARRLSSGKIVLLCSLYGTPWGPGKERRTRNTTLPQEDYVGRVQTFFLTSEDGVSFTGPHYILPGLNAHEFDAAELPDGRLLFVAGDVQGTPVGRQFVSFAGGRWINGPVYPIQNGAPPNPAENPQGGFVPETLAYERGSGCLIGYRRNQGWSVSNDDGANWVRVQPPGEREKLYQPMLLMTPDGRALLFGHAGGDQAFGQKKMRLFAQRIRLENTSILEKPTALDLERLLSPDKSHYENNFLVRLTAAGKPLVGEKVCFRFVAYWNADGSVNTTPQAQAPLQVECLTDEDGCACARAIPFDKVADIHLSYTVDVAFAGKPGILPCVSPAMTVLALTPWRRCLYPYDAYFAGGVLYLSPSFLKAFPNAIRVLKKALGEERVPAESLGQRAVQRLLNCGAVVQRGDGYYWIHSVHAPLPLSDVCPMESGDWYV